MAGVTLEALLDELRLDAGRYRDVRTRAGAVSRLAGRRRQPGGRRCSKSYGVDGPDAIPGEMLGWYFTARGIPLPGDVDVPRIDGPR